MLKDEEDHASAEAKDPRGNHLLLLSISIVTVISLIIIIVIIITIFITIIIITIIVTIINIVITT